MEIHIARGEEQLGPFPPEEVRRQLAAGTLLPTDLAWAEGASEWVPLGSIQTLAPVSPRAGAAAPPPLGAPVGAGRPVPVVETTIADTPRTSGAAVVSLICGVLSVSFLPIFFIGLVAVVCGHVARSGIRKAAGGMTGDGMATAGLVTGYFGIGLNILVGIVLVSAVFLTGAALPFVSDLQSRAKQTKSLGNAKMIVTACHLYALEHHDVFPRTLDDLVPKYLPDRSSLACPLSPDQPVGYDYFGGTTMDASDKVLLRSKFVDARGRRIIAHVDGSCVFQVPPSP